MAGCVLAAIGFASITVAVRASGDDRYTDPLWQPLYGVLLAGSVLVVLGLPAVLAVHGQAFRRLTLVGYVGIFAPLVMLNVAETTIEAFVLPYLARHGGIPSQTPAGLNAFEGVALLLFVVGAFCFAIAVFRARIVPLSVGVALIASVVCVFVLHGGAIAFISDYLVLAALCCFGWYAAPGGGDVVALRPVRARSILRPTRVMPRPGLRVCADPSPRHRKGTSMTERPVLDDAARGRQHARSFGTPNSMLHEFDFWDARYEGRRLFSELLGTFFLVLVAVGGGMVNARFGGSAVPYGALVVSPALMVGAIILFMGAVSGAHLNPAVSIAFALRGDFPWRRVPAYVVAQLMGAILATLLLEGMLGEQGSAGLTCRATASRRRPRCCGRSS